MIQNTLSRRMFAAAMMVLFGLVALAAARPLPTSVFLQQDEKKKLPPVNWIRSRTIDIKNLAIDLRFDWEKEQAIGSTTVTFSPFNDTDHFSLDAAMMTINLVTLANGTPLKYTYDGKKDGDNLEIMLDRVYKGGEDVSVKVDYKTNYVNSADADTAVLRSPGMMRAIDPANPLPPGSSRQPRPPSLSHR